MPVTGRISYFLLEHPEHEITLCDRQGCDAVVDYLEVEADGTEHRLCAFHTMSDKYASRLPTHAPDPSTPHRRLQII